jgi:hypothetical protein
MHFVWVEWACWEVSSTAEDEMEIVGELILLTFPRSSGEIISSSKNLLLHLLPSVHEYDSAA